MRLQKETESRPQPASRLNGVVFGVALLWLAMSLLLLVLSWAGSSRNHHPRKDSHQQFARMMNQAIARASSPES